MSALEKNKKEKLYRKFDGLNGDHPFKRVLPNGFVDYQARSRKGGKVAYFNFDLAKEMGLISKSHENELTDELTAKILDTFSIQIINEYDIENKKKIPAEDIRPGTYMATRYLQLQHGSKKGKTSGDGRSVWNGQIKYRGKQWDVSSGGTGGTCLSPATSKYNKFFETGDPSISYGCGYAEIDEGFTTAIFSQIYHQAQKSTERSLAIIEFNNNISINIRAHQSLIRPSHIFLYLKQDDYKGVKSLVDYYIESQREKPSWGKCPQGKGKYDFLINKFMETFANLSADFEDEYIFCWLDWDGDNILMDGGVIDYGSIRQFGLCHSEYRYDDVDRFSTSLFEQKTKAKYIVQTMLQATEFIKDQGKKNIQEYAQHEVLQQFENTYENKKNENLLFRIGLSVRKAKQLLKRDMGLFLEFKKSFIYLEMAKSHRGEVKLPDGITVDAIFSMRNFLREFPQIYLHRGEALEAAEVLELLSSALADDIDCELTPYRKQKLLEFQNLYIKLIGKSSDIFQESMTMSLLGITKRSQVINQSGRATGDAITFIVDLVLKNKKKLSIEDRFLLAKQIGASQNYNPDVKNKKLKKSPDVLFLQILDIFEQQRDGI